MEQISAQEPVKKEIRSVVLKEWDEDGKHYRLIRETGRGEHDIEEVEEETGGGPDNRPPHGWHEVFLSECEILREYKEDGKKRRDIIYKKLVKGEDKTHPKEETIVPFKATQELINSEWITMPDTETRISNVAKGIM